MFEEKEPILFITQSYFTFIDLITSHTRGNSAEELKERGCHLVDISCQRAKIEFLKLDVLICLAHKYCIGDLPWCAYVKAEDICILQFCPFKGFSIKTLLTEIFKLRVKSVPPGGK